MTDQAPDLQRQIDELVASVAALTQRADASHERANAAERRADDSEARAQAAEARVDATARRVDEVEARSAVDRELLAELQADGMLSREHVSDLETALVTSRVIGAALGILMASRNIGEAEALTVLKGASQRSNTKMRTLAETIVAGADAIK